MLKSTRAATLPNRFFAYAHQNLSRKSHASPTVQRASVPVDGPIAYKLPQERKDYAANLAWVISKFHLVNHG